MGLIRSVLTLMPASALAATLTWDPVTTYEDGTALDPVYFLYCGPKPGAYTWRSPELTEITFRHLQGGTWWCAVTVSDGETESAYSNEIQVTNRRPTSTVLHGP